MNHTETLTRYTANFVDELVCSGLRHAVISPGSRSTPLAMLLTEHEQIKEWVLIDERSAAYFALGIAKQTKEPVVIVCTSGTAAANYFPAIVEAYYQRVPLVVLTADRPHELRDVGASQTINQVHMYGDFVKQSWEMAPPEDSENMLHYVRNRAARVMMGAKADNPGPIHVNFPFREPLTPDLSLENIWGDKKQTSYNPIYQGEKQLTEHQLKTLANKFQNKRGLIVCGPQVEDTLASSIVALSEALGAPILADPLSQLRTGNHHKDNMITTYDTIFRSEKLRAKLAPDYIIRFGAMPVSKSYLFFVEEHEAALQIVVENHGDTREPTNHQSEYVFASSVDFCNSLLPYMESQTDHQQWLTSWQQLEQLAEKELQEVQTETLTEGEVIRDLIHVLPNKSILFVANSMPIRDVDTFLQGLENKVTVYANRGTSGIDGTMSSALGVAATTRQHVTLLIGDLSFYHDMNSLLAARHYKLDITIILINNNGGGIFSFLPQAKEAKHFEALFGTPLNLDFKHTAALYGATYQKITTKQDYIHCIEDMIHTSGINIIEIGTNREENVTWHRKLWQKVETRLLEYELNL